MLKEYKQACYDNASFIDGWKNIDKNELCRKYVAEKEAGNDWVADNYLSAIIYKFWNVTEHNYHSQPYKKATEGDCIDWTITGILKALTQHIWDDPTNVLYGDPKGPEKAINTCIYSTKINFYQKIQHQKEKISYEYLSLEQLMEDTSDSYYLPYKDRDTATENYVIGVIKESFNKKEYLKAFVLDSILNFDVFDTISEDNVKYTVFSDKKLRKQLRDMDGKYCKQFASRYGLDLQSVLNSIHYVTDLDYSRMFVRVNNLLKSLKHDKGLIAHIAR